MPARRLSGPTQLTNVTATKYTAPAGIRGIVRHIHVSNPSGAPVNFTLSIGADAAAVRVFDAYPIAAGAVLDHYCYYALVAAEILAAFGSTTLILVLTINGEEEAI